MLTRLVPTPAAQDPLILNNSNGPVVPRVSRALTLQYNASATAFARGRDPDQQQHHHTPRVYISSPSIHRPLRVPIIGAIYKWLNKFCQHHLSRALLMYSYAPRASPKSPRDASHPDLAQSTSGWRPVAQSPHSVRVLPSSLFLSHPLTTRTIEPYIICTFSPRYVFLFVFLSPGYKYMLKVDARRRSSEAEVASCGYYVGDGRRLGLQPV